MTWQIVAVVVAGIVGLTVVCHKAPSDYGALWFFFTVAIVCLAWRCG